jgi:hypothetical protein
MRCNWRTTGLSIIIERGHELGLWLNHLHQLRRFNRVNVEEMEEIYQKFNARTAVQVSDTTAVERR